MIQGRTYKTLSSALLDRFLYVHFTCFIFFDFSPNCFGSAPLILHFHLTLSYMFYELLKDRKSNQKIVRLNICPGYIYPILYIIMYNIYIYISPLCSFICYYYLQSTITQLLKIKTMYINYIYNYCVQKDYNENIYLSYSIISRQLDTGHVI